MTLTKVKNRHQITLPRIFRKELNINEGDYVEIVKENDKLIIIPQTNIPKSQAYFWTKEWQKDEKEVDKDIAKGNLAGPFSSVDELFKELKS